MRPSRSARSSQAVHMLVLVSLGYAKVSISTRPLGHGAVLTAAATTVGDKGFECTEALIDAEVDVVVIDTAHGHNRDVARSVERVKKLSNSVQVIAGNIATGEAAKVLAGAGADAVKVGIGPGSICTTRVVAGVGRAALQACQQSYRTSVTPTLIAHHSTTGKGGGPSIASYR